ncbi:MAG: SurA N-terminal domain-containing protein [Candidatus Omnitrophica bacterium]|nr:SurA N-terminal domain-containing protein [Candidatus Omnitrophota bacterium]
MLQFLRKKENLKKIMWGLAILIIPAFVLWGSGSSVKSRNLPKYAGKIFGKKISFRRYESALHASHNQALLIYGDEFEKIAKFLNFDQEVWDRLILLHQATVEKIKVTDEEVIEFIQNLAFFQEDGRFSQKRYNLVLDYAFHSNPRDFEEQVREMLAIGKLKDKVFTVVELSEDEIKQAYTQENEQARASYIFFDPQEFTQQIHPAYKELKEYYGGKPEEFKKPDQVNVQYIALYFEQTADEVEPAIEKEQKELLEDRIWDIAENIGNEPTSFQEQAEKKELEIKETGFFGPQQVIPEIGLSYEFLTTAFSLKVGEISNVIETPKGYFIIKVKEKKESYVPPLDEVRAEIETAVMRQKSWELAKQEGQKILEQLKSLIEEEEGNFKFNKAVQKLSLEVAETEQFSRSSYISGIGQSSGFSKAAFRLTPGAISELISIPNGYCILSLKEIVPIEEEKFTQNQEEFSKSLLARKQEQTFKIWLAKIKYQAKLVNNIEKLKAKQAP